MSRTDELISRKRAESQSFDQAFQSENAKLKAAVALIELRKKEGLTQRELAEKTGKPQSTIARIENGNMNATVKLLEEIAQSIGRELVISFQ
ncbi:MAG: XRE family transcriptional regulator [Clostridia bacterium]|nr:XRE family transcriptional regulator [Clostridia bacterium]NCC83815.1 XRE family transcriptional regulator [Clostridia bacterium]